VVEHNTPFANRHPTVGVSGKSKLKAFNEMASKFPYELKA
jgi:hypothetical protein